MTMMNCTALTPAECRLGEGILWSASRDAMLFVDIHGKRLLQYRLSSGELQTWRASQRLGWVLPCEGHAGLLAGFQEGFAFIEADELTDTLSQDWLALPFGNARSLRLNDAKADAQGRVWAGSLNNDDESLAVGTLMRLGRDGDVSVVDTDYRVANGPAIHPDGHLLLHTDSARRVIYAFDLDADRGTLSHKRVWLRFSEEEGYPDGMNFDAQGRLWVAHWGTGFISQFDLNGALLQRFKLPVSNVTNLAFGGEALDRLFVTTAWQGLSEAQRMEEPLAGALFEVTGHGATGLEPLPYRPVAY